jgi:hypothetical protein
MSSVHRTAAEIHLLRNPNDPRSVEELEVYYRDLSLNSPVGQVTSSLIAADTADRAIQEAKLPSPGLTQPKGSEPKEPKHVDDWIDTSFCKDEYPRWFFFLHRLAAVYQMDWRQWISQYKLFCTYQGIRYRCTGASRMGDIWLAEDHNRETGYDLRVSYTDCTDWAPTADGSAEVPGVLLSTEAPSKKSAKLRNQMIGYRQKLRDLQTAAEAMERAVEALKHENLSPAFADIHLPALQAILGSVACASKFQIRD